LRDGLLDRHGPEQEGGQLALVHSLGLGALWLAGARPPLLALFGTVLGAVFVPLFVPGFVPVFMARLFRR